MALNVTIQDIVFSTGGNGPRKYKKAEVTYTWQGNNRKQTVMSFSNPDVFKTLESLKFPASVDVELTKVAGSDGKEYTNWAKVSLASAASAPAAAESKTVTKFTSNYETPEERAKRQLMIVRQSSISNAIEYFKGVADGDDIPPTVDKVLELAQTFVDFVYGNGEQEGFARALDGIKQDIPE